MKIRNSKFFTVLSIIAIIMIFFVIYEMFNLNNKIDYKNIFSGYHYSSILIFLLMTGMFYYFVCYLLYNEINITENLIVIQRPIIKREVSIPLKYISSIKEDMIYARGTWMRYLVIGYFENNIKSFKYVRVYNISRIDIKTIKDTVDKNKTEIIDADFDFTKFGTVLNESNYGLKKLVVDLLFIVMILMFFVTIIF